MRFATWKVYFPENSNEGITPEAIIRSRGGSADGILYFNEDTILGCISDNAQIDDLESYSFTEITESEALNIAISKNNTAFIGIDGTINFDPPSKI